MISFTASKLKNEIGNVLNAVQKEGKVEIKSKSRPTFVIIEKSVYEQETQKSQAE